MMFIKLSLFTFLLPASCGPLSIPWQGGKKKKNVLNLKCWFWLRTFIPGLIFLYSYCTQWASQVALVVRNLPAKAGDARDTGSILGSGRFPWRTRQPTPRVGHDWAPPLHIHHTQYSVNVFFLKEQWLWSSFHTPGSCPHPNLNLRRKVELSYMYTDDERKWLF